MGSYQSNNAMRILSDRYTLASAFVSLKVDMHLFHASWVYELMPRYNNQMCLGDKNAFLFFPHEIFYQGAGFTVGIPFKYYASNPSNSLPRCLDKWIS